MSALGLIFFITLGAMIATMLLSLARLALGPSVVDRAVASDVMSVAAVGITVLLAVRTERDDVMVLAIMFSLVGFMYSVTIGRFNKRSATEDTPVLSEEEARKEEIRQVREAQSELHAEEREAVQAAKAKKKQEKQEGKEE